MAIHSVVILTLALGTVAGYRSSGYLPQSNYFKHRDTIEESSTKETYINTPVAAESTKSATSSSTGSASSELNLLSPTTLLTTTVSEPLSRPSPNAGNVSPMTLSNRPETVTEMPITLLPALVTPLEEDLDLDKRRHITYDQRQDGQYNIRADLENFMIVLIPPTPSDGLNLLDLLNKSSLRRNVVSPKGNKRKQYQSFSRSSLQSLPSKYLQSIRAGNNNQNFNYLSRQPTVADVMGIDFRNYNDSTPPHSSPQQVSIVENVSSHRLLPPEFIEGRTPYHVDISASNEDQSRLHLDRQVDVLPPPYPLAYQHFINPYHLEVEPTVIQALPPPKMSSLHVSADFLETFNQILASSLNGNSDTNTNSLPMGGSGQFYRMSRAITGDNFQNTNRLTAGGNAYPGRRTHLPLYRSDFSFGAANLYPPIDVPRLSDYITVGSNLRHLEQTTASAANAGAADDDDSYVQNLENTHPAMIVAPPVLYAQDDVELKSQNARFVDFKHLLSDGMERCAPGRRRDSYGVCREIEGY